MQLFIVLFQQKSFFKSKLFQVHSYAPRHLIKNKNVQLIVAV